MMKFQSIDFLVGYLFNSVEREYFKNCQPGGVPLRIEGYATIPKIWFGLPNSKLSEVHDDTRKEITSKLTSVINDLFPKYKFKLKIESTYDCYVRFDWMMTCRVKKVTISELEDLFDCKVEIVPEEDKE